MMTQSRTIYVGSYVHSVSLKELEEVEEGMICVNEEGVIEWAENRRADELQQAALSHGLSLDDVEVVELAPEEVLCPGMIDTHTHAPQYPNNGLGQGVPLLEWLDTLTFPTECKYASTDFARKVYERVVRTTLNAGTTTACYYGTWHLDATSELVEICKERGQRAMIGKCSMDRNSPDYYVEETTSAISSARAFVSTFPHPSDPKSLVRPILTPRMAISCSPDLLTSLAALAREYDPPLAIQTHLSENDNEIKTVAQLFPDSKDYTAVYDDFGLLGPQTILAHCVHLTKEERAIIKRRDAGVSHCPTSNFFIGSGIARIREMLDEGIKVGLGSDCSGGYANCLLPVMRVATHVSYTHAFTTEQNYNVLSLAEAFYLATMGGARLCGLEKTVGNFQPGKEFDALRIKGVSPGMWIEKGEPVTDRFQKWIWCGDDRDIREVYVRGRKVGGANA